MKHKTMSESVKMLDQSEAPVVMYADWSSQTHPKHGKGMEQ